MLCYNCCLLSADIVSANMRVIYVSMIMKILVKKELEDEFSVTGY